MFCRKCGSSVSEGIAFCPKCGAKVEASAQKSAGAASGNPLPTFQPAMGLSGQYTQQSQNMKSENKSIKDQRKLFLAVGIGVAVVVVIALIAALIMNRRSDAADRAAKEYSVVGEWYSRDAIALGEVLQNRLEEQGNNQAVSVVVATMLGDAAAEINLTFTDSGSVYIGFGNVLLSIGEFTYEDLGNNKMLLQWNADISVLGTGLPIAIAYRAEYQVDEDTLRLDLFGYDAVFDKAE